MTPQTRHDRENNSAPVLVVVIFLVEVNSDVYLSGGWGDFVEHGYFRVGNKTLK